jgi:UDP-galactopyranose mutase
MRANEAALLARADLVFTGGQSLYEAKRHLHHSVHAFPSSIDVPHFQQARSAASDPSDQRPIARPRLGFAGVIDERMDIELVARVAHLRPDWQLVLLGPVVKISPADLPVSPNIHYLGPKKYEELPTYIAGWDVAILPFARNDSTRFISPTKTPEYLAAGKPVVSTSIRDVVRTWGEPGHVHIADTPEEWVAAAEKCLDASAERASWLSRVDAALAENSWGRTWGRMMSLLEAAIGSRSGTRLKIRPALPGALEPVMTDSRPAALYKASDQEDMQ